MSVDTHRKATQRKHYSSLQKSTDQTRKVDKFRGKIHHEKAETCRPNRIFTTSSAYITLKDHKGNLISNPSCRLINPSKSELGK